jgi:hypothetical protein
MLDVALRGIGDRWNDVVIPGFDFCVVENTLGKYGTRVETLYQSADQRARVGRPLAVEPWSSSEVKTTRPSAIDPRVVVCVAPGWSSNLTLGLLPACP